MGCHCLLQMYQLQKVKQSKCIDKGETETIWKGKSANQQVRGEDDNINSVLVMQFQKLEKQGVKNNDLNSLQGISWQSCG